MAKLLDLTAPFKEKQNSPLEFTSIADDDTELIETIIPHNSKSIGKAIVELNLPEDSRIVLIVRDNKNIIPSGGTILEEGDVLLFLINKKNMKVIKEYF